MKRDESPHSQSLRKGRYSQPGQIYLVTTTTHQRRALFSDLEMGREVVKCIAHLHHGGYVGQLAYVLMPDHLHWLFELKDRGDLSRVVGMLKGYSSRQIRRVRQQRGDHLSDERIWQNGFHDHALRKDEELLHVARYMVANPLRAGLVERLGDYSLWDAAWV